MTQMRWEQRSSPTNPPVSGAQVSPPLYSGALWREMLGFGQVWDEAHLKGLFVKGLQPSIRHIMRAFWATNRKRPCRHWHGTKTLSANFNWERRTLKTLIAKVNLVLETEERSALSSLYSPLAHPCVEGCCSRLCKQQKVMYSPWRHKLDPHPAFTKRKPTYWQPKLMPLHSAALTFRYTILLKNDRCSWMRPVSSPEVTRTLLCIFKYTLGHQRHSMFHHRRLRLQKSPNL